MTSIINSFKEAFLLLVRFDPEVYRIIWLTLEITAVATAIGAVIGIPIGVALAEYRFRGRHFILTIVHSLMGMPAVVVGALGFMVLARSGPLGALKLIYDPAAMVVVQVVLAVPLIAGFTHASMAGVDPRLGLQAMSLGATRLQSIRTKMREARAGIMAALIAGFGGVISKVGAVMIVGGNIKGQTRVLTTDIVQQMRQGNFELAVAEGMVLMLIVVVITVVFTRIVERSGRA